MVLSSVSNRKHVQEIIEFDSIKKSAEEHATLSEMFYNLFHGKIVSTYKKEKEKKESKSPRYIMEDEVSKQQSLLTENFTLFFRALLVSLILLGTNANFTWVMFSLTFGIIVFWMSILIKFHQYLLRISKDEVIINLISRETLNKSEPSLVLNNAEIE